MGETTLCVPVCKCVSQHDGWYSQHTQTVGYQQSLEAKKGTKKKKTERANVEQRLECKSKYRVDVLNSLPVNRTNQGNRDGSCGFLFFSRTKFKLCI